MADKIFAIVRVNKDPSDTHAATMLHDAIAHAQPDEDDFVEHGVVSASDAGAARLKKPKEWRRLVHQRGDWFNVGEGDEVPNRNPFGAKTAKELAPELQAFEDLFKKSPAAERTRLFKEIGQAEGTTTGDVDAVLKHANKMLDGHGIEAIQPEGAFVDRFYRNTIALYVNMGDTYETTLLYDTENEKFAIGSWGDFLEHWEHEQKPRESKIAYRLPITKAEYKAIEFYGGRYKVSDLLWDAYNPDTETLEFEEHEMWELSDAVEEEGWPGFAPKFQDKLQGLLDKVV